VVVENIVVVLRILSRQQIRVWVNIQRFFRASQFTRPLQLCDKSLSDDVEVACEAEGQFTITCKPLLRDFDSNRIFY
jgi:hypothetical protein